MSGVQATAPARAAAARPYRRQHTAAVVNKTHSVHRGRRATVAGATVSDSGPQASGAEVAEALDGSSLFLVGMMGTGKSSVGKKLAAALGYNFFDT
jgi:hypothetical protein